MLSLLLSSSLAVRVVALATEGPATDVLYYLKEGVQALLSGVNPYTYDYTGVPAGLLTPGTAHLFAYLPGTLLYLVPFYALGDIRLGFVAADLVVGSAIFLYRGRWGIPAAALFLFTPFTMLFSTVYLNASLVSVLFLSLFFVLESRGQRVAGAMSYGIALASGQFAVLLLPLILVYYLRRRRALEPLLALLVGFAVVLPFLFVSPSSFFNDVLVFQFGRDVSPLFAWGGPFGFTVNPSLSGLFASGFGVGVPPYAKVLVEVGALGALFRVRDISSLARSSTIFLIVSSFVLPNDFFWAYLETPFVLGLFWLSAPATFRLSSDR